MRKPEFEIHQLEEERPQDPGSVEQTGSSRKPFLPPLARFKPLRRTTRRRRLKEGMKRTSPGRGLVCAPLSGPTHSTLVARYRQDAPARETTQSTITDWMDRERTW